MNFSQLNNGIPPPNYMAMDEARQRWDSLAKPKGSLGLLEDAVTHLAGLAAPPIIQKRVLVVMCADHGVTEEGVASTPTSITRLQAANIANKTSAVGIFAQQTGTDVLVVDTGMFQPLHHPAVINRRAAAGTQNMARAPAMSYKQALDCIQTGIEMAGHCRSLGYHIITTGEMGVGNTTASSAIAAVLLNQPAAAVTGRGAGLSDETLAHKAAVIETAIKRNQPSPDDPVDVLAKVGGFEIAALCGLFIGAAQQRLPIVLDGLISSAAALAAVRLCPMARHSMLASHLSGEPAARMLLDELALSPLICAGLRLGEGTGALAALPLLDMALAVYHNLMPYSDFNLST